MIHRFHTEFAKKYGLLEAVILEYFIHWVHQNEASGRTENFREGRWWAFNTVKKVSETFDYLSEWKVRTALDNLIKAGALIPGNYNQRGFDHTKWYSLSDEVIAELWNTTNRIEEYHKSNCGTPQIELRNTTNRIEEYHKSNCGTPQIELRNTTNRFDEFGNAIPIKEPIKGQIKEPIKGQIKEPIVSNAREESITWAGEGITLFERSFGFLTEKVALGINELAQSTDWESYKKAVNKAHRLFMESKLTKGRVLAYVLSATEGIAAGQDFDAMPKRQMDMASAAEELERRLSKGGNDNGNDSAECSDSIPGLW